MSAPRGISPDKKRRIIEKFLLGYSPREIHVASKNTVTKYCDEFCKEAEERTADLGRDDGVLAVARQWNVTPICSQLVEISKAARDSRVGLDEMIDGALLGRTLLDNKVDRKNLQRFVVEVYKRAEKGHYSVDAVIDDCEELKAMEKKYGNFEKIVNEWTKKAFELQETQKELGEANRLTTEAEDQRIKSLARAKTTEEKVDRFLKTVDFLTSVGVTPDDAEGTKNVLSDIREQKFKVKAVVSKLKRIDSLDGSISKKNGEVTKSEERLVEQKKRRGEIKIEIESHTDVLKEGREVVRAGLSIEQMANLRKTVVRISSARGIAPKDAMAKFEKEVEQKYDSALGFEESLKASAKAKELADGEVKGQEERARQLEQSNIGLEKRYGRQKKEVNAYSRLRARGVGDVALLRWDHIVESSNLTYGAIEAELVKQGDLSKLEAESKERITKAESRLKELNVKSEKLREQYSLDWDSMIQYKRLRDKGVDAKTIRRWERLVVETGLQPKKVEEELAEEKTLNRTRLEREKELKKLETESQAAGEQVQNLRTDVRRLRLRRRSLERSTDAILKTKTDEATAIIEGFRTKVEETYQTTLELGKDLGKFEALKPLVRFISTGEGRRGEVVPLAALFTGRLMSWCRDNHESEFRDEAKDLDDKLNAIHRED